MCSHGRRLSSYSAASCYYCGPEEGRISVSSQRSSLLHSETTTRGEDPLANPSEAKKKKIIKSKPLCLVIYSYYSAVLNSLSFFAILQDSQQENFKSLSFGEQSILGKYCIRKSHTMEMRKTGIGNTYRKRRGHGEEGYAAEDNQQVAHRNFVLSFCRKSLVLGLWVLPCCILLLLLKKHTLKSAALWDNFSYPWELSILLLS